MDILAAGQALRSCATSSRGGKNTSTTCVYYSDLGGGEPGPGQGRGYSGVGDTESGRSRDTLLRILDSTLLFPTLATFAYLSLETLLQGGTTPGDLTSTAMRIAETHGAMLRTRFNALLHLGNNEPRVLAVFTLTAALIWLATTLVQTFRARPMTRDAPRTTTNSSSSSSSSSGSRRRSNTGPADRFRGGGDSDSDGRLSLSGLSQHGSQSEDETEIEGEGAAHGETREGFLDNADRAFVAEHGATAASNLRAPTQGSRLQRPPNGNCLYHSLAQTNVKRAANKLKKSIAAWVKENWNLSLGGSTVASSTGLSNIGRDRYHSHITGVQRYGNQSSWGGITEIIGYSRLMNRRVAVYATSDPYDNMFHLQYAVGNPTDPIIHIVYSGNHYDNLETFDNLSDVIPENSYTTAPTINTSSTNTSTNTCASTNSSSSSSNNNSTSSTSANSTNSSSISSSNNNSDDTADDDRQNDDGDEDDPHGTVSDSTPTARGTRTEHTDDDGGPSNQDDDADFDGATLVGRWVMKFFQEDNNWFLGQITEASPPVPEDPEDEGWLFHVRFNDGDEGDYPRTIIEADILPPETGEASGLHRAQHWPLLKKIYDTIHVRLHKNTFDAADDQCLREVFNMRATTRLTVQNVKQAFNRKAKKIHPDKTRGEPARVRHLANLVFAGMQYLQQTNQRHCDSSASVNDKPLPENYPEYHTEEFAAAASTATETVRLADITQPEEKAGSKGQGSDVEEEEEDEGDDQTGDGSHGPLDGDGSDYSGGTEEDGPDYPDTLDALNSHSMDTLYLSPFQHVTWIPKGSIELWAAAFNIVTKELIEAITSSGPGRSQRISTAARWYLGLPQLFLRDANRSHKRNAKVIRHRLTLFINKQYGELLNDWRFDLEKAQRKMKPLKKDTPERRLEHAINLFHKGYVSRGLSTLEGNGRASADDPAIQQQMRAKHPQVEGEECFDDAPPPANQDLELPLLDKVVRDARGLVGVGPRGLKAGHIKVLESGAFNDDNAKEAFDSFTNLGILYLDCRMPRWLRRTLNAGLLTPLVKTPAPEGETPDARPTNAREMDVACWTKALQRSVNDATRTAVAPQQLAVGVSGGTHIKIIGAKLRLEQALKEGLRYVHCALDLRNAHNSYSRRACQDAIEEAAAKDPRLIPLARAHHSDCGQAGEVYMRAGRGEQLLNGFKFLCTSFVGGPQGSALTNQAFPLTIDGALKRTEAEFPGVTVRAIQDDCDLLGDPDLLFGSNGDNGALQYLLDELKKVGLEPNLSKFQAYATPPAVAAVPSWLKRPFYITCPVLSAEVEDAKDAAEEATAWAKTARDDEKEAAIAAANAAANAVKNTIQSVPEQHRAYGVKVCGAALGDKDFEAAFLEEKQTEIVDSIKSVSTKLAVDSAHAASTATYYSLQCRADFLLETHLPSLTRNLARNVDDALRGAYTKAFGFDILDSNGQSTGERDPTFLRDLAGLKAKDGGCGYRNTERRAVFLNTLNNVLPQMTGDGKKPGLWPSLATVLGADSFKEGNEATRWETFFASESAWAMELESEIERVKSLRVEALNADGRSSNPPAHKIFDVPSAGFGAGVKKLQWQLFNDIRRHEAAALRRRASALRPNDQRKLAYEQSCSCRFSNVLFSGMPSSHTSFTNNEFHAAVQNAVGAPLSLLKQAIGLPIKSTTNGTPKVDPFGNNIKKLKAALGGGTLRNHNSFVDLLSFWLARASVPHRGGKQGKPQTCKNLFSRVSNRCRHRFGVEGTKTLQEIIPDLLIDGRFLSTTLDGAGANLLRGTRTLADVKTKSCDDKYPAERSGLACAVVTKRQQEVSGKYHKKAGELDIEQGTAPDDTGPFQKELNEYGQNGRVIAPVVGAFAEMSPDTYAIADLISSALANEHCSFFADKPSEAKGMFAQRLYRSLGLAAHLGWARLLVDRYRDLVELPTPTREDPSNRHHITPDDEDAFEYENYHNPDTPNHTQ